jgi:hypothetical protein
MQTLIKFLDKFYCAFRVYYVIRIRSTLPEIKMLTDVQTNTTYPLCTHFMYFVQIILKGAMFEKVQRG